MNLVPNNLAWREQQPACSLAEPGPTAWSDQTYYRVYSLAEPGFTTCVVFACVSLWEQIFDLALSCVPE